MIEHDAPPRPKNKVFSDNIFEAMIGTGINRKIPSPAALSYLSLRSVTGRPPEPVKLPNHQPQRNRAISHKLYDLL